MIAIVGRQSKLNQGAQTVNEADFTSTVAYFYSRKKYQSRLENEVDKTCTYNNSCKTLTPKAAYTLSLYNATRYLVLATGEQS